jgi:hypothetical protein
MKSKGDETLTFPLPLLLNTINIDHWEKLQLEER